MFLFLFEIRTLGPFLIWLSVSVFHLSIRRPDPQQSESGDHSGGDRDEWGDIRSIWGAASAHSGRHWTPPPLRKDPIRVRR